jgi:transglutaminase-like putative cysteine protease
MRIRIAHETLYRYDRPVRSVIQVLRLTPSNHAGQHTISWQIEPGTDGRLRSGEDGFGNIIHVFSAEGPLDALSVRVSGVVDTADTAGTVTGGVERVPEAVFLRDTALTSPDAAICEFAEDTASGAGTELDTLHRLLVGIHGQVAFDVAPTNVGTTAAEAFALRRGVCQDLTHIFIASARHLGIPARYVSGYFHRADGVVEQEAAHAWAEARVPGLGWVGFDPANGISPTDAHVRIAVGLDYLGAAPIRGSRRGGGDEALDVTLRVDTAQRQSQS